MEGEENQKEVNKVTPATPSATLGFVDRVGEMDCILDALKVTKAGEGQLLLIRGEAGCGKTRLVEEAAGEAEKQGFSAGFGTALAESAVPYHPWKEVLEALGLDAILEEAPPPKLLGFYLLTTEGRILVSVEREDINSDFLSDLASTLAESVRDSRSQDEVAEGGLTLLSRDGHKLLLQRGSTFHLGAIVGGQEDEAFLADMMALADKAESVFSGEAHSEEEPHQAIEAHMLQLLDSETYEGFDYAKEDPKLRQNRLFEHITLGLHRKAGSHPICVVIDDLQWADPSSLALLHYVVRNTRKAGVLLLCTYRVEEADVRPHLRDALKGMEQEEILAEVDLNGLAREDLADLAKSFIGSHALPGAFLDLLWQETQGYPLFVREVLRGLEEDSAFEVRGGVKSLVRPPDQLALPERVREVISARLDRLPKAERRLLDAAATCGTRFTAAFVAKVAEEGEAKVLNGLSAIAKVHGLLRLTENGFAFDHPAVQEVIYDDLPPEIRQTYHKEAAEWLELVGGPIEDVGEHYYRARDPRAVKRLREAAEVASASYANEAAARFYREMRDLAEDEEGRREILEAQGAVCKLLGDYEAGQSAYESALELAKEDRQRAGILVGIGQIHAKRRSSKSMEAFAEALHLVEGMCCEEEALALLGIGLERRGKCDYEDALECYKRGLAVAEKLGDSMVINRFLNSIGVVYHVQGRLNRALANSERGMALAEKLNDQVGIGKFLNSIGLVHSMRGDYDRALESYERGLAIKERIGDPWAIAGTLNNIGVVHKRRGDYDRALEYFKRGASIAKKGGHLEFLAALLGNIGNVHLERGDYDEALEYHYKNLELDEKIGGKRRIAIPLINIGRVHLERGDYDRALEYLDRSVGISEDIGERYTRSYSYCGIAEIYLKKRDLVKALEFCNEALSLSTETGQKENIASSRRILGIVYRESSRWTEAIENFQESIRISEEIGSRLDAGKSRYEFGCMWKAKGDAAKARGHLEKAAELFEALKIPKRAAEARAALEALDAEA